MSDIRMTRRCLLLLAMVAGVSGCSQSGGATADGRARIEAMTETQKQQLRTNREQFARLDPHEQRRLRKLQTDLERDPQRDQLEEVMFDYARWLETLPAKKRSEHLAASTEQRLEQLKRLHESQKPAGDSIALTADDLRAIVQWFQQLAVDHQQMLVAELPAGWRANLHSQSAEDQRRTAVWLAVRGLRGGGPRGVQIISFDSLKALVERLSPSARAELDAETSLQQKLRMLRDWVQVALREHAQTVGRGRMQPAIPQPELDRFVKEDLTAEQRTNLEKLPDAMRPGAVRRQYLVHYHLSSRGFSSGRGSWPRRGEGGNRFREPPRPGSFNRPGPEREPQG